MRARLKIAVIDDLPDNRLIMRSILEDHFEVSAFDGGPQALAEMPTDLPDLVLLDISMPGMDGFEVLRQMRTDPRTAHLRIVAFTASADRSDALRFRELGFDALLVKPILDPVRFVTEVHAILESTAAR